MKNLFANLFVCVAALFCTTVHSQQWGLYTLYAPLNSTQTFLIDTMQPANNYKVWAFPSNQKNGYSAYLKNDTLVRSYAYTATGGMTGGGVTGAVQKVLWNGTVVWDFKYNFADSTLHHDIHPMNNGNVLMIVFEKKTAAQAVQAGSATSVSILSEKIMEVRPTGPTTGEVVWEWKLWDHLCQTHNSTKDNYVTSLLENPQLLNINVGTAQDRFHMNGIDYNEALDQIVVSMHYTNEIYVIDHSTTTAQPKGHSGGNSGKGGDFLYRWGKPANYGASGTTIFNVIHDAHWVPADHPTYPNHLCAFNNKGGTAGRSAFNIWNPPYNGYDYSHNTGQAYAPATSAYQYSYTTTANNTGNSQQLPNGNALMCIPSMPGYIIEVNAAGQTLWTKQASSAQAHRYSMCYVRGPKASASASANEICENDMVTLSATAISPTETNAAYTYQWSSQPPGFCGSGQHTGDTPMQTTTYIVTITNTVIGCSVTDSVTVTVYPAPGIPVITQNGASLSSSAGVSHQWYLNGLPIIGATGQNYTPMQSGAYQVEITGQEGCPAMSAVCNFVFTSLAETNPQQELLIYPNPSGGIILLGENALLKGDYAIFVYDMIGNVVFQGNNIKSVDLSECSNGIYYLTYKNARFRTQTKKIIILK